MTLKKSSAWHHLALITISILALNSQKPPISTAASVVLRIRHHLKTAVRMSNAELATSYAALILADDGVDITVSPTRPAPRSRLIVAGRQTEHTYQSRRCTRRRTDMGNIIREGTELAKRNGNDELTISRRLRARMLKIFY